MEKLRNKKAGVIVNFLSLELVDEDEIEFTYVLPSGREKAWSYSSLEKFKEEWEIYKPTEPLIKDEKIRKAVRAWLEANDLEGATYYTSSHYWYLRAFNDREQGIDFWLNWENKPNLIENKYYTKTELCGEDKE